MGMKTKSDDPALTDWLDGVRARLRAARTAKGLTHRAAGAAAGVAFQTVTRIEGGKTVPSLDVVYALCAAYEVPLCEVLCEGQLPTEPKKAGAKKRAAP